MSKEWNEGLERKILSLKVKPVPPLHSWILGAFIGLGIVLRVYNFWKLDLWIDEYGTWWVIAGGDWGEVARRSFQIQGQSPFFYFLVKLSSDLLGAGPVAFRLPSLLFGIATLGLAYPLALRLFNDCHVALLATAAFAVNEKLIFFSQDARPYALALLCTMLSFLCYLALLTTEARVSRIGYLLATAGAYYAHYLFGVVVMIQVLHLCLTRGWAWVQSKAWRTTGFALALLCLPGAAQLVNLYGRRETMGYLKPTGLLGPVRLALNFLDPWVFFPTVLVVLALGMVGHRKGELQYRGLDLALAWFILPILFFAVVPPLFEVRLLNTSYTLAAVPGSLFLVAWLMGVWRMTLWGKWVPLVVFLTLTFAWTLIPDLRATGTFSKRAYQGWKKAANLLEKYGWENDLVIYRVGFIQADQLPLPNPDPQLVSFVRWPLAAHLSSDQEYQMIGLPWRESTQNASYVSALVKKAAERRRVWIIGTGGPITGFAQALLHDKPFRARVRVFYGDVQVILLEQSGE